MSRRRYEVDGRLRLSQGDKVKISPKGRRLVKRESNILLSATDTGIVEKIEWDAPGRFYTIVNIRGYKLYFPISDVRRA